MSEQALGPPWRCPTPKPHNNSSILKNVFLAVCTMLRAPYRHHSLAFLILAIIPEVFSRLRAWQPRDGTRRHEDDGDTPKDKLRRAVNRPRVRQISHRRRYDPSHGLQKTQRAQQFSCSGLGHQFGHAGLGGCEADRTKGCNGPGESEESAGRGDRVANVPNDIRGYGDANKEDVKAVKASGTGSSCHWRNPATEESDGDGKYKDGSDGAEEVDS